MRLVVGHELDEQLAPAGDDGGGGDLPTELPQHGGLLVPPVKHLHVVIPGEGGEGGGGERERKKGRKGERERRASTVS